MKIALLFCLVASMSLADSFTGKCVGVSDGDTIKVMHNGVAEKIRLAQIDTPESNQDFGTKAKQFTSGLVFGKTVKIDAGDKDQYGRTIATPYIDGKNVCVELVRAGLAWNYVKYSKDKSLADLEAEARKNKIGLWSQPNPTPPWEFRKEKKKAK